MLRAGIGVLAGVALIAAALAQTAARAEAAAPRVKAKAYIAPAGPHVRLHVHVTSRRGFTARSRPRAVRLLAAGKSFRLDRRRAGERKVRWRSLAVRGQAARLLMRRQGSRVTVKVKIRSRWRTFRVRLRFLPSKRSGPGHGDGPDVGQRPGPSAPPPVDRPPDHWVAPGGDDSGGCTREQPCRTFERAYAVASPGELVEVAGGDYPAQTVRGSKPSGERITFRGAPGATVRVGMGADNCSSLRVNASHVELANMTTEEACADAPLRARTAQSDVTFRNVRAPGGFQVNSTSDVSFIGGDYGGDQSWNNGIRSVGTMPRNILIDGAVVHDVACDESNPGCHIECLIVAAVDGLTIRNSVFHGCAIMNIFFETFNGPISNVLIENNFMADATEPTGGEGTGRPPIMFKGNSTITNVLIRFNSLNGPLAFERGGEPVNARVIGNVGVMDAYPCHPAVSYSYNIWNSRQCGDSDAMGGSSQWVSAGSGGGLDYHLKPGSKAIDFVPDAGGDSQLGFDIDGHARPSGPRRDAGADEHG